jgi:hypothetical protein
MDLLSVKFAGHTLTNWPVPTRGNKSGMGRSVSFHPTFPAGQYGRWTGSGYTPHFFLSNEPSFGNPWIYNWTGHSWRTQENTDPTGLDLWEKGCRKESNTCHGDYVGTWDKDHGNFTRTTIQTDSYGNITGHIVNFDGGGIHIDAKYTGVFASNTQATVITETRRSNRVSGNRPTNDRTRAVEDEAKRNQNQ